ncbi:TetR/AcrR family transcriptional regulator [Ktedonospora formicarum]|uniref:TetR family transcriptional regulator n=1 Tax=Ktedonospora formicarum TaxID=2778364 RepID=A0A8J3I4K6_9CHLR|nr:TetR/AcrR family transcriptional regulator [Ktedonospora formicarum]GHO49364.1 TetR family transcriptional regulator [Ktedonospora formicarum]
MAQDRRVKRTQHLLAEALIALTLEQGYDTITIRDITERAEIGYATFFRHYPDKDALLRDVLDVVLNELMELLPAMSSAVDAAVTGTLLFRYVAEHEEVVRVLLSSRGSSLLMQKAIERGEKGVLSQAGSRPGCPVPVEVAAYHMVSSSIALIQWWLEKDMPYPPEAMGVMYRELIIQPTKRVVFSQDS